MKNPGRNRSTKRCVILHLPWLQSYRVTELIFEKCSFDQPPISYPSPLLGLDKPSPGSNSTYSETTCWLQQSQSNIDHFWKKDMALVKALRQYHVTSNILEGCTQWKFQKSQILHQVLDVTAMNMEITKRCLDFHDSMPVDQGFRCRDLNLHQLKAVAVKEVMHLTMILMLDKDHTHYNDAFRNIFEGGALCKKCFPNGSGGIQTRKGRATQAIVCHFCLHGCSNDDYAYHHLLAIHLNIQWGCRMFWIHQWVLVQNQGTCTVPSEKELQGVILLVP